MKFFRATFKYLKKLLVRREENGLDTLEVKLKSGGSVNIEIAFDIAKSSKADRDFISGLVEQLQKYKRR